MAARNYSRGQRLSNERAAAALAGGTLAKLPRDTEVRVEFNYGYHTFFVRAQQRPGATFVTVYDVKDVDGLALTQRLRNKGFTNVVGAPFIFPQRFR